MAKQDNNMLHLVDDVRQTLRFRKLVFCLSVLFSGAILLLLLFSKISNSFSLRDDQQFALFCFIALPSVILLFKYFRDYRTKKISRQGIALKVEEATPELMDSYVCALEIAEKGGATGRIEKALTASVSNRFKSGEIQKIVTPSYLSSEILGLVMVVALFSALGLFENPLLKSVGNFLEYQRTGVHQGFEVTPGNVNLAKGSDLEVSVKIESGELKATLEYMESGEWKALEMNPDGEKTMSAVVYSLEDNTKYRVITDRFKSKTYDVVVFLKPDFEKVEFAITPPEYTKKKSFVLKDFKNFAIPQDSKVNLALSANKQVSFSLLENNETIPISSDYKINHSYEMSVSKSANYQLKIIDADGNEELSKPFKVSVVRDMPPHIEIAKPAKDLQKTKFDIVTLEVSALDDYGLTAVDLHIDYSFGSSEKNEIYKPQGGELSKEENLFYDLNLKDLGLTEGDVLTYYLEARDNAEPKSQVSRTKIYFLEIRPDKNDVEDKEEEQEGGDEQELSVDDLIATQKDLIRSLIDTKSVSPKISKDEFKVDAASLQELSSQTATLRLAVQKRMDELKKEAEKMGASLGVIGDLFASSIEQLKKAEDVTGKSQLVGALRANNKSLSDLIKIAIELEKNSQKSQSKQQQQQKEDQQQQQQQEEQEQERLADMLKKLEDLEDQQQEINDQLKETKEDDLQEQQALQEKMQEQQERLEEMSESLQEQQQQQASENLQQAAQQMQQGQQQMQQGDQQGAQQQSQQAQQRIENAKNDIKRAMRDQARKKLKQLADVLDKTVEEQQDIKEKTQAVQNPTGEEGKKQMAELKKRQDKVQETMQKLMDQFGAAANELDEKYPEVAEALRESREFASNQGIDRRLKRSSNALHYRRQASAEREQSKAEEAMTLLGYKVRDAVGRLPQATLEELMQMLQEVEVARRQVGSTSAGISRQAVDQRTEQIQKMLEEMGQTLQNTDMEYEIPQNLESAKESDSELKTAVQGQMNALNQAAFILDSMISKADLEKRLTLNKRTGNAPDKYKRSVREYLKSLSDGQE